MITVKIKDGCWRPYLSMDQNHFQKDTASSLGEHLRQVSKKSDQWSPRRCDHEKKFRDDGRMPDSLLLDKLYLLVELQIHKV